MSEPCECFRPMPRFLSILVVCVVSWTCTAAQGQDQSQAMQDGGSGGAITCPCVGPDSMIGRRMSSALSASGYPSDYGLLGCNSYFSETSTNSSEWTHWHSRDNMWCYVDPQDCSENHAACVEAGGRVGDRTHARCTDKVLCEKLCGYRYHSESVLGLAHYSYETCGNW